MFKATINVTDLKSSHSLLADLSGNEAIQLLHRGSEPKVIVTEAEYNRLKNPSIVTPMDVQLLFDPSTLVQAKSTVYIEDREVYTLRLLSHEHKITMLAKSLIAEDGLLKDMQRYADKFAGILNNLYTDGLLKGLCGSPVVRVDMGLQGLAYVYRIVSMVLISDKIQLPDYAKKYEVNEAGNPV